MCSSRSASSSRSRAFAARSPAITFSGKAVSPGTPGEADTSRTLPEPTLRKQYETPSRPPGDQEPVFLPCNAEGARTLTRPVLRAMLPGKKRPERVEIRTLHVGPDRRILPHQPPRLFLIPGIEHHQPERAVVAAASEHDTAIGIQPLQPLAVFPQHLPLLFRRASEKSLIESGTDDIGELHASSEAHPRHKPTGTVRHHAPQTPKATTQREPAPAPDCIADHEYLDLQRQPPTPPQEIEADTQGSVKLTV
jgi:hypothetical protein